MKLRLKDKKLAIELRLQGKSYGQIIKTIPNLPKSTLSNWIKNVKLTKEQEKKLKKNIDKLACNSRLKSALIRREKRLKQIKGVMEMAEKETPTHLKDNLFITGLSLYWAEGTKKSGENIQFSNSDPEMIKLMIKWFEKICGIPKRKMKVHIYIHDIYKNEECEKFWAKMTGIPTLKFGKTTYKPTPHKIKKNLSYKGVCRIEVHNVNLFRKIMGWKQGFIKSLN